MTQQQTEQHAEQHADEYQQRIEAAKDEVLRNAALVVFHDIDVALNMHPLDCDCFLCQLLDGFADKRILRLRAIG